MIAERLCGQPEEMKAAGYDGDIFHPRYFPGMPPYVGKAYLQMP